MYKKAWCTCKFVVLLNKPIAFLTFSLPFPSPSPLLKLPIFNMWTVSSDVSIQRRHWQPLSVHLWANCTHPTHDVNDVLCEGWPQLRGLRPLLFSNGGVGSFSSHKNQLSVSAVRRDGFSSLSEKTRKCNRLQMSLQRQHFLLSYLKTLSVGPAGVWTRDLPLSRPGLSQLSQPGGVYI